MVTSVHFHGFRYVQIDGLINKPKASMVKGLVMHTDMPSAGEFKLLEQNDQSVVKKYPLGMRGNYLDIPTDCPQRDERLGWTGDAQVFIRAGPFNYDITSFHRKWIRDLVDAQFKNGAFTDFAPFVDVGCGAGHAAWADAGIIVPWEVYRHSGDKRILSEHYDAFVRFIEYMKTESKNLIRPADGYGDWLSINADTPKDLIGTAYFARSTRLLAKIAETLGKQATRRNTMRSRMMLQRRSIVNSSHHRAASSEKRKPRICSRSDLISRRTA